MLKGQCAYELVAHVLYPLSLDSRGDVQLA
jgi:hypothetical protein